MEILKAKCLNINNGLKFKLNIQQYNNIIEFLKLNGLSSLIEMKLDLEDIPISLRGRGKSKNLLEYIENNSKNPSLILNFSNYFLNKILDIRYGNNDKKLNFYFNYSDSWSHQNLTVSRSQQEIELSETTTTTTTTLPPTHFNTNWVGNGLDIENIYVIERTLYGNNLDVNDEIAVFDGILCVGVVKIVDDQVPVIKVSKNDGTGNGYVPGNTITYKYWDNSENLEIIDVESFYYNDFITWSTSGEFEINASAYVRLSKSLPDSTTTTTTSGPPPLTTHFEPIWEGNGLDIENIYIVEKTLNGVNLAIGDEVAIFDGTSCVGVGKITDEQIPVIKVSRNDGTGNGYTPGHPILYKYWDSSANSEITGISTFYYNNMPEWSTSGNFEANVSAFVRLSKS